MQIEIEVTGSITDGHIEVLGNYFIEKMIEDLKKEQLATTEKRHYESVITGLNNYKDNHFNKEALIEHKQNLDKAKIII